MRLYEVHSRRVFFQELPSRLPITGDLGEIHPAKTPEAFSVHREKHCFMQPFLYVWLTDEEETKDNIKKQIQRESLGPPHDRGGKLWHSWITT